MIFVTVSTGHFDPLIECCDQLSKEYSFFGQIGSGAYLPSFPFVRMLPPLEIENKMREATLVISHAGTGMLSMLYKLKKPCIVIPKQRRYGEKNDGQVELAMKWTELGMGLLCLDLNDLGNSLEKAKLFPYHFPPGQSLGANIIDRLFS